MGRHAGRTLWARGLFAAGILGALGFGAAPAAIADTAPAATAPVALTCDELVGPEFAEELAARGYVLSPSGAGAWLPDGTGTSCFWTLPGSERIDYTNVAYAALTPEQLAAEEARLLATGSFARVPGDAVIYRSIERAFTNQAEFVPFGVRYHFVEGYWILVNDRGSDAPLFETDRSVADAEADELAATVEANVLRALAPTVPEPALAPDSEPDAVAPPGFTADSPSVLSGLRTLSEAEVSALSIGCALGAGLVLIALVGLPGRLVESALTARYDEWRRMLPPGGAVRRAIGAVSAALDRLPAWVTIAAGLVIAAVLSATIEPEFGFNGGTARVVSTLLATMLIESLLGLVLIAGWLARAGIGSEVRFRLGSLVVIALTALASRLTGFEPGFVFGMVLVLVALQRVRGERQTRQAAAEVSWLLGLGVVAWIGYSAAALAFGPEASAVGLFVVELLAGLTVGALSAAPLLLIPVRGLPGRELFLVRRRWWVGGLAVSGALFAYIVLPLPESWGRVDSPVWVWIGLFAVYAVVSVGIWALLTFLPRGEAPSDAEDAAETTPTPDAAAVGAKSGSLDGP